MHLFVLRHFHHPFYLWSILSGFKKLPNRPQSDQQNRQSLKWYFYKIKPAHENTLTLVLIWEFITLYDMGFCSARPTIRTRVLTIYMKTPEIPAGKSHSPRHSVWEAFEIWAAIWVKSGSFSIDDGNRSENISFKKNSLFSNTVAFIPICWKWQCRRISLEFISWGADSTLEREKEIRSRLFTSSIKLAIRHFHVVVVQGR